MGGRLTSSLLDWFCRSRRALPWRSPFPRDPYRTLVAEVMLQQTQVERVVPAYLRFLARFPTVEALAAATEDEVMQAFSGLGYYRRARALLGAAQAVVSRGTWPTRSAELATLAGFGGYTSAAVAAFCFGGGDPPVDGNVARIAARTQALSMPLGSRALAARGEALAREVFKEAGSPEVWEALMELGATVCTPRAPRCEACPWASRCAGRATGRPEAFPLPRPRRAAEDHLWVALWIERDDGRVLLRRTEDGPLFRGLWLPPLAGVRPGHGAAESAGALARQVGVAGRPRPAGPVRHSITHRRITVAPFILAVDASSVREAAGGLVWQDPLAPTGGTSTLLGKLHAACAIRSRHLDAAFSDGLEG